MSDVNIRPDVALFLQLLNSQQGPKIHEGSPAQARALNRNLSALADVEIGDLAVNRDINIPGPNGDIPARIFDRSKARAPGPVMVFFHGGGFVIGDLDTYAAHTAEVARLLDIPVISIDYRLAPEAPFPAAAEDCEAATRWIASNPEELGFEATGLIISGDSAGGNLTIVTTMALRDNPADIPVILQHPVYPAVSSHADWQSVHDFAEGYLLTLDSMRWFNEHYQPAMDEARGAPLDFDQAGMPPTLVTTASLDPLRDQGLAYFEKLKEAGVIARHYSADGNIHGYLNLRKAIPSAQQDLEYKINMLKEMLAEIEAAT